MIFKPGTTIFCEKKYAKECLQNIISKGYRWRYYMEFETALSEIKEKGCLFYLNENKVLQWHTDLPLNNFYYDYKFIKYSPRKEKLKRILENDIC
jgi:hypothetical protein